MTGYRLAHPGNHPTLCPDIVGWGDTVAVTKFVALPKGTHTFLLRWPITVTTGVIRMTDDIDPTAPDEPPTEDGPKNDPVPEPNPDAGDEAGGEPTEGAEK